MFYQSYAEGHESFFATEDDARAMFADWVADYPETTFDELFREVDLETVNLDEIGWGVTSDETKEAMIAAVEAAKAEQKPARQFIQLRANPSREENLSIIKLYLRNIGIQDTDANAIDFALNAAFEKIHSK